MRKDIVLLTLLATAVACSPKRVHEEPIIEQGDRVPSGEATVEATRERTERARAEAADRRAAELADALADCTPDVCRAIARGEVVLGMNRQQVLAATGTTEDAWTIRQAGGATVIVPARLDDAPDDAVGDLAMIQLRDGRVSTYSYLEPQGIRVVSSPDQATSAGRAAERARMLVEEGDDYAARGDLDAALDRYDRASVLSMDDPMLEYRIATVLDKQLRPIEAQLRYRLFLHRLELERIQAVGEAYANIAAAAAHARERLIVLERHGQD